MGPKTNKAANVLNYIETNNVKKECYLIRQDNTTYKLVIKLAIFKV